MHGPDVVADALTTASGYYIARIRWRCCVTYFCVGPLSESLPKKVQICIKPRYIHVLSVAPRKQVRNSPGSHVVAPFINTTFLPLQSPPMFSIPFPLLPSIPFVFFLFLCFFSFFLLSPISLFVSLFSLLLFVSFCVCFSFCFHFCFVFLFAQFICCSFFFLIPSCLSILCSSLCYVCFWFLSFLLLYLFIFLFFLFFGLYQQDYHNPKDILGWKPGSTKQRASFAQRGFFQQRNLEQPVHVVVYACLWCRCCFF